MGLRQSMHRPAHPPATAIPPPRRLQVGPAFYQALKGKKVTTAPSTSSDVFPSPADMHLPLRLRQPQCQPTA